MTYSLRKGTQIISSKPNSILSVDTVAVVTSKVCIRMNKI